MTEGGLLYVALATGIVVIALQALVLVRAGLARAMLDARWRDIQGGLDRFERELRQELAQGRQEAANAARGDREEQSLSLSRLAQTLAAQLAQLGKLQAQQLESFAQQLSRLTNSNEQRFESLRLALEARLAAMQSDNALKLEEMRRTVDEKLHATLEQRLGESFKLVSDRLEQVHRGLGEMQTLATGVGDLKRVLTNVKTRGTWGEVQLEALLDQLLTAEQYGKNVATRPDSPDRVEFAIRLPGLATGEDEQRPVWLPIDAKFPLEDYQRLLDAQERRRSGGARDGDQGAGSAPARRGEKDSRQVRRAAVHDRFRDPLSADRGVVRRSAAATGAG
jgi:DNA recombination protein RmuC